VTLPVASLSLDLDNKWSYMKTHGDPGWESFPSYLDVLVPRVLSFLKARNLTVTFFIVGQDAALEKNHEVLRSIAAAGHEIGNHSFQHEPWLHLYSENEIEVDVTLAEEHIGAATGQRPTGFRAPGYSLGPAVLEVLARRGYHYDASTFPNLVAPLARSYYFMTANFTREEKRQRRLLGGTLRDALRPVKPYLWRMDCGEVVEIPVSTMPLFRLPIHLSYLLCVRVFSRALALRYFDMALKMCQWTGIQPSLLLHPTDFLGCDDMTDLPFVPGMNLPSEKKLEFVSDVLRLLTDEFSPVSLHQYALAASQMSKLPIVEPKFS
jgi:peptidoglycan-N-acetylglucosamine deacetylase